MTFSYIVIMTLMIIAIEEEKIVYWVIYLIFWLEQLA